VIENPNRILIFLDASYLTATNAKIATSHSEHYKFEVDEFQKQAKGLFDIKYFLFDKNHQEMLKNIIPKMIDKSISRFLPSENITSIKQMIQIETIKKLNEHNVELLQEKDHLVLEDYKQIVEDAENLRPPFSAKKQNEVKDAQILYSILNYLKQESCTYATFLSHDKDWHDFFDAKKPCGILSFAEVLSKVKRENKEAEIKQKLKEATNTIERDFQNKREQLLKDIDSNLQDEKFVDFIETEIYNTYSFCLSDFLDPIQALAYEGHVETSKYGITIQKMFVSEYPELVSPRLSEWENSLNIGYALTGYLKVETTFEFTFKHQFTVDTDVYTHRGHWCSYPSILEGTGTLIGTFKWNISADKLDNYKDSPLLLKYETDDFEGTDEELDWDFWDPDYEGDPSNFE